MSRESVKTVKHLSDGFYFSCSIQCSLGKTTLIDQCRLHLLPIYSRNKVAFLSSLQPSCSLRTYHSPMDFFTSIGHLEAVDWKLLTKITSPWNILRSWWLALSLILCREHCYFYNIHVMLTVELKICMFAMKHYNIDCLTYVSVRYQKRYYGFICSHHKNTRFTRTSESYLYHF